MDRHNVIPQHIAIIMDGNGRWAKQRGKDRSEGHFAGMMALKQTVMAAAQKGVKWLTVYAFSTENWGRPQAEVDALMDLVCKGVEMNAAELRENGVRVQIIGERSRFCDSVKEAINRIESTTAEGEKMTLVLALNYSSRSELTMAVQQIARRVAAGELQADAISEQTISQSLYTAAMPDPDLIIRTSGEYRLSNFLMWQASYAEFYFTDTLWPDFGEEELGKAIEAYNTRDRRYGLVK
ncbi:MAG: isoprenyl transferase [Alistipes sp.]|nr:isoprenyl transferase [Alistipes sp.]MBO5275834.1 isoprenyl transferase [Alistipes sp.]MBO5331258.1 isoprenyl transferase [Alistipes sp.]MBP3601535.1 isoprenyl transferase [Alistipes sp.]MBR3912103.1 isoprenyl transferase [Alistipes sp.]